MSTQVDNRSAKDPEFIPGRAWLRNVCRASLALLALTAPAVFATPAAKPLTPPAVLGQAKTMQFTVTLYEKGKKEEVSKAVLERPNRAYVVDTDAGTNAVDTVYASDGTTQVEYRKSRSHYTKSDAPVRLGQIDSRTVALSILTDFLDPAAFAKFAPVPGKVQGVYYLPLGARDGQAETETLTLDPQTGLPQSVSINLGQTQGVDRFDFADWTLNAPVDDSKFAYTPPADASLYTPPKLLANGTLAPDFMAADRDGHPVHLSDYKGKTVVLDFWATWCGPCQMSLPHTTKVAQQDADKGVVVLAVNVWDTPTAFQAWLPKHPQYAPLHFAIDAAGSREKGIATDYGVSGIPTQYVIGPDGKIVKSIVGYDPGSTDLEDALKTAGVG